MNKIVAINTKTKFKDNAISLNIPLPLDEKVTDYNLIVQILKRGCTKYKTAKEAWEKLQDLYGAVFDIVTAKKGELFLITFYLQVIDDKFALEKENLFEDAVEFLSEYVNNPLITDGQFNEEYFLTEKENLKDLIESRIDDKDEYAIDRAAEICCAGETYEIFRFGDVKTLEGIKNSELVKLWKKTIKNCDKYFYICGNTEQEECEKVINKYFRENANKFMKVIKADNGIKPLKEVIEPMNVNQGKLAICYKTSETAETAEFSNAALMNSILGGGIHSKLFIEVREKNSLAYYCYSFMEKFKGLLIIAAGIDSSNYEKTKKIIFEQIEEIKRGNITEQEFNRAKSKMASDLMKIKDSQYTLINYLVSLQVYNIETDIDQIIENTEKVKKDDVVKSAEKLNIGSVYFLTKGN